MISPTTWIQKSRLWVSFSPPRWVQTPFYWMKWAILTSSIRICFHALIGGSAHQMAERLPCERFIFLFISHTLVCNWEIASRKGSWRRKKTDKQNQILSGEKCIFRKRRKIIFTWFDINLKGKLLLKAHWGNVLCAIICLWPWVWKQNVIFFSLRTIYGKFLVC